MKLPPDTINFLSNILESKRAFWNSLKIYWQVIMREIPTIFAKKAPS